ncbi:hypothetical protein ON021_03110 [Microcoleus sp. HI-ES]|nr:hypothetical protein [Microcoleus sp. HI-ES]
MVCGISQKNSSGPQQMLAVASGIGAGAIAIGGAAPIPPPINLNILLR